MDLVVQESDREGWAVVRASGDLDLTTAPRLRERVVKVVTGGQPHVVLDLQQVDFVDSTGLGVLVGLLKRTRSQGGDLRLVSTRLSLQKVLELTSLDQALPLARTVDDALSETAG
ncbi:MAG: STAS domain-containing protein [Acidimicrobiales bacterium]